MRVAGPARMPVPFPAAAGSGKVGGKSEGGKGRKPQISVEPRPGGHGRCRRTARRRRRKVTDRKTDAVDRHGSRRTARGASKRSRVGTGGNTPRTAGARTRIRPRASDAVGSSGRRAACNGSIICTGPSGPALAWCAEVPGCIAALNETTAPPGNAESVARTPLRWRRPASAGRRTSARGTPRRCGSRRSRVDPG